MENNIYDLIIIGAGPAGLSASIYASRYSLKHVILGTILGGQISETHNIDNYPGMEDMNGAEFSEKWGHHAKKYGVEILPKLTTVIEKKENSFLVHLSGGEMLTSKAILLATGTRRKELGIEGEEKLKGKGVSYCATCDGFFFKNKKVVVIGGGNSAVGAAIYLVDIVEKVYLIYRGSVLRAEPYKADLAISNPKIEIIYNSVLTSIQGEEKVEKVIVCDSDQHMQELETNGVFIEIGSEPNTDLAMILGVELDNDGGYIKINKDGSTNIPGVFAAGDITDGSDKFRQVITAASEGAIAARGIFNFVKK